MVIAEDFTDQTEGAFKVANRANGFAFEEAEDTVVHSVREVGMCG